jgi:Lysyl oxidase
MSELLPKLEPLKGEEGQFDGEHSSLYKVQYDENDRETGRETIRFSIAIANTGKGELHIILGDEKSQNGETIAPAKQRIYKDNGEFRDVDVGYFEKHIHQHPGGHDHPHWHYDGLATLDLLDNNDRIVATSKKTSYCVVDVFKYEDLPNSPQQPKFSTTACENKNDVGISVGWADYYRPDADQQYIEVDKIESGTYSLRFKINKTDLVSEESKPVSIRIHIDKEKGEAKPVEKE